MLAFGKPSNHCTVHDAPTGNLRPATKILACAGVEALEQELTLLRQRAEENKQRYINVVHRLYKGKQDSHGT